MTTLVSTRLGSLGASGKRQLAMSNALLPIYGIGLAILALLGLLVYSDPAAMSLLSKFPLSARGIYSIPALAVTALPGWFAGVALVGIFVGGLVPAAIMAISQANLLARNVIRPLRPGMDQATETRIAKWASVVFKFVALGFVFMVPATYAIQLQLLGGIIILQTLPAVFLGLVTRRLNGYALTAGLIVGLASGVYLVEAANKFGPISTSLLSVGGYLLWIGLLALALNLAVSVVLSLPTLLRK
ncbi:MAG: hypothetical protein ACP5G6_07130 [Conexivisphaera sp.]|jgi:SSS family solute:Na+ symporter